MTDFAKLAEVLSDEYCCTIDTAPAICLVWSAETLMDVEGIEIAKRQLSAANRHRDKIGKTLAYLNFGHPLF